MSKKIYVDEYDNLWVLEGLGEAEYFDAEDGEEVQGLYVSSRDFEGDYGLCLQEVSYAEAIENLPEEHRAAFKEFVRERAPELVPDARKPGLYLMFPPNAHGERMPLCLFESGRVSAMDRGTRMEFWFDVSFMLDATPSTYEEILAQTTAQHRDAVRDWLDAVCAPPPPPPAEVFTPGLRKDEEGDYFYMHRPWSACTLYLFFMRWGYEDSWEIGDDWRHEPISYTDALAETEHPEEFRAWCQRVCPELIEEPKTTLAPGFYTFDPSLPSLYYYSGEKTYFLHEGEVHLCETFRGPEKAIPLSYVEALKILNGDSDLLDCFVEDTDTWKKVWISSSGRVICNG